MADSNRIRLRGQLVENYEGLIRKLTRRLGSADFAHEALHETFLRLDRVTDAEPVRSPADYIFRTAINIAKDRRKAQNYRVSASEIDVLLDICDDEPDPARVVEARSEIEAFKRALAELPPRPREVLQSISIEGQPAHQVAARLKVSIRTVESDLKLALGHCADSLEHTLRRRLGGPRPRS
ncbi:sigma-70 family RNA polymerase sigma factor [Bradyrhizobium sp. CB1717]|nr:sigma-70 family RNA polymerase sigma factor [Bradyrhizobium sp. CB1717]WFU22140.1 sigma-70 family RNA polymerase sigma factor [Bradyrhizobium sp. CB1717]